MGIFDFAKKQFIDVIEWLEPEDGILAYRYPMRDQEIQNGAKLTVRESQLALFVNEGQVADQFGPGLHTLTTKTLPLLTNLKNWDKLFASPFKSDVYFFSAREQLDCKWGTQTPITFKDKEMGAIRLRAFGSYSYRLADPRTFYQRASGTREIYRVSDMDGQLRGAVMTAVASGLGRAQTPFVELAANQGLFSDLLKEAVSPIFAQYGLALTHFFVQSVSLPDELQKYFDKAAAMRLVGDMGKFIQFQTGESIPAAAANPGGLASAGAGLGAGVAMGQAMAQAMAGSAGAKGGAGGDADPYEALNKLHALLQKGVITQAEFDAKKSELLKKL